MGLIDFKTLLKQASENRANQRRAAQELKKNPGGVKPAKKRKKRPKKKKRAQVDKQQVVCKREGCYSENGPFSFGLCSRCYEILRYSSPSDVHCHDQVPVEHQFLIGQKVLVSCSHPQEEYRGLYGDIVILEDEGRIALIEFDGDTMKRDVKAANLLKGKRIKVVVDNLLAVEL